MDAIAYQMSFDEGQLALLCANYDRRIDSLDAENKQLQAENEKLRELVMELYDELDAATQYDAGGGRGVVYEFADRMRGLGVEVVE